MTGTWTTVGYATSLTLEHVEAVKPFLRMAQDAGLSELTDHRGLTWTFVPKADSRDVRVPRRNRK